MSVRPLGFQLSKTQADQACRHLNLARREAWRFQRRTRMEYDDLESAAFLGLLKACRRFDPTRGWRFSSYAVPAIKGELLHHVRDNSFLLRLTHRMRELWVKGRRHSERGVSDQQVAKELGIPLAEWLDIRQACCLAVLELKPGLDTAGSAPELREDDRLSALELTVERCWQRQQRLHATTAEATALLQRQKHETVRSRTETHTLSGDA